MSLRGSKWVMTFSLLALTACDQDTKRPNYEYLPDMVQSVPYDAFAPNPNTPKGQTLMLPVPGTIPRGFMPYPYPNTPEGAEQAGRELKNPIPFTPKALARGEFLYKNFCLVCHGETGEGDGPLIPKYPNPPAFASKDLKMFPEGRLFHVITYGSGQMASYASQIRQADRWKLVYYLQTLQGHSPGAPATETQNSGPTSALTPAIKAAVPGTPDQAEGKKP